MRKSAFLKKSIFWCLLLNGIIISLLVSGMYATGSKSLTNSLKFGKVSEPRFGYGAYTTDGENKTDIFLNNQSLSIDFEGATGKWRYLYLDIESNEKMQWNMAFHTSKNKPVYQESAFVEDGVNKITLPGKAFSKISINVNHPEKCTFTLKNVQLREKERINLQLKHIGCFVMSMMIYIVLVYGGMLFVKKRKINFYKVIDVLQDIYISLAEALLWIPSKFSSKQKRVCRVFLLTFWQIFMMYMGNTTLYEKYYKYIVIIACILVLGLAVLMMEPKLRKIQWKSPLVFYWFILSIIMCVSEYIFPKRDLLMGAINIFVFGFLYFVWNNTENQKVFVRELMLSLKYTFIFIVVFSVCFRPMIAEDVYSGAVYNVNVFAMYLVPIIPALLSEIQILWHKKERCKVFLDILLLLIDVSFIHLSGSRAGMLLAYIIILLYLMYIWKILNNTKRYLKFLLLVFSLCIALVPTYLTVKWSVKHIPSAIGKEIEFSRDNFKSPKSDMALSVKAAEKETLVEQIVYSEATTKFLTSRNFYWMGYIRNLNVLGHEQYRPQLWSYANYAHNGILEITYRYGIFAMVPYAFLFFGTVYYSFYRLQKTKDTEQKGYEFFVFGLCVVVLGFMMIENIERAFFSIEWMYFYLVLGYLFSDKEINKVEVE